MLYQDGKERPLVKLYHEYASVELQYQNIKNEMNYFLFEIS